MTIKAKLDWTCHQGLNRWAKRSMIVWVCCLHISILAHAEVKAQLDLSRDDSVEFAMNDNPVFYESWIKQQVEQLNPNLDPLPWMRAFWFSQSQASNNLEDNANSLQNERMNRALALAKSMHQERVWVSLKLLAIQSELGKNSESMTQVTQAFDSLLAETEQLKDKALMVPVLISYATQLMYANDLSPAIELVNRSDDMVKSGVVTNFFDLVSVKGAKADLLDYQEKTAESILLYRAVIQDLQKRKVRRLLATRLQDFGITLQRSDNETLRSEGFTLIQIAYKQSHELKDLVNEASCLMHIANYYSYKKDIKNSIHFAKQSIEAINQTKNRSWTGYLYWFQSSIMIRLSKWQEALDSADEAIKNYRLEDLNNRKNIHDIRYEAYKGLGRFADALKEHEELAKAQKALDARNADEQYHRASAKMGLEIEKEKNKILEKDRELQIHKLDQKRKEMETFRKYSFALGSLVLCAIGFLILSLRQTRRLRLSRDEIQLILDHMDEGMLTMGADRKIGRNYSRYLHDILGIQGPLAGLDFLSTLLDRSNLSAESRSMTHEVIQASLGEDHLAWQMNSGHLPLEIQMGDLSQKTVSLRWVPIINERSITERLLVILSDVTKERTLESALSLHEKRLKAFPETLRELLNMPPESLTQLLSKMDHILANYAGDRIAFLRELHTQKGVARSFRLKVLSAKIHNMESACQSSNNKPLSEPNLLDQINLMRETIDEYRNYRDILNSANLSSKTSTAPYLASALESLVPAWIEQLKPVALNLKEIRMIDGVLNWKSETLTWIQEFCMHAVTNSLDHGFILPLERGEKVEAPVLQISAGHFHGEMILEITDNGVGLDMKHIEQICQRKGFTPTGHETKADVLFLDGVSTARDITLRSGRGVGLSAIKARVDSLGGSVSIANRVDSPGTILSIRFPTISNCSEPDEYSETLAKVSN